MDILKNKTKDWKLDLRSFIARWVTPTTTIVNEIIANAGKMIDGGIHGIHSPNTFAIQNEMKCIYDYLSKTIKYVNRPLAFAEGDYHAQRVSLPSTTIKFSSGNCIDLSVLLASCFEALNIPTFIILVPKHAFIKVKLSENENVYIESTCMGIDEYAIATERGRMKYDEYFSKEGSAVEGAYEIDISIARKSQIYPME